MNVWITMIIAGVLTYAQRLSFIIIFERTEVPESARRALRLVPPAVLTAIITPELFLHNGSLDLSLGNHRLIAGILATVVAWRTKNIVLTILVGMAALLLLSYFT
ncbi:MAG: AzlD domain-containing protein [Anaerolineales bacterium]|jgi:branched-subunit amino acid transport protein